MTQTMEERRWRYQNVVELTPTPAPTAAVVTEAEEEEIERGRDRSWQRLLTLHMPFHLASESVYARLVAGLSDIEALFLTRELDSELASYYEECNRDLDLVAHLANASRLQPSLTLVPTLVPTVRHVAALQVQFMEEVFKGFRLDRYANAPDSRGWMNTFRRWGCSPRFNAQFDRMEEMLTENFVVFYYHHVRDCPYRIELRPVPHPWDLDLQRVTKELPRTLTGIRGLSKHDDIEASIFLDSGISEVRSRRGSAARTATQAAGAPASKEGDVSSGGGGTGGPQGGDAGSAGPGAPGPPNA